MSWFKILGWLFAPYVMLPLRWDKMNKFSKVVGFAWTFCMALTLMHSALYRNTSTAAVASPPETNPPVSNAVAAAPNANASENIAKPTVSEQANASATQTNTQQEARKEYQQLLSYPKIAQSHEVGNFNITINGIEQATQVGSGDFGSTANGRYWIVSVTVRNDGTSPNFVTDSMFQIVSPIIKGKVNTYSPDPSAEIYVNSNSDLLINELNPGVSQSGFLVFDMPSQYSFDMAAFHLEVSSGLFGAKQGFSFLR